MPPLPDSEVLAPAPAGSRWGRMVASGYLVLAALAVALTLREVLAGAPGWGATAIGVLTAPWSMLLSSLGPAVMPPGTPPGVIRGVGLVLVVVAAGLNARILYGMAARAERDARAARAREGDTHG